MEQITVKQLLQGMADAVPTESDRLLTEDEMHALHAFCEGMDEDDFTIESYLGGLGEIMDRYYPPINVSWLMTYRWIKTWWW